MDDENGGIGIPDGVAVFNRANNRADIEVGYDVEDEDVQLAQHVGYDENQ